MHKIANTTVLQTELRRILAYAQSERPSRSRIAGELRSLSSRVAADGARRSASGHSYADALKDMEADFLGRAALILNRKQKYVNATVKRGVSMSFLQFDGVDTSDLEISGTVALLDLGNYNIKMVVEADGANGKIAFEPVLKAGVLDIDKIVNAVLDCIQFYPDQR